MTTTSDEKQIALANLIQMIDSPASEKASQRETDTQDRLISLFRRLGANGPCAVAGSVIAMLGIILFLAAVMLFLPEAQ